MTVSARARHADAVGGTAQTLGRVQKAMHEAWHVGKPRHLLGQVKRDAAHAHFVLGVGREAVGDERQVERHDHGIVAANAEGFDKGVVAQATATVKGASAGSEMNDAHDRVKGAVSIPQPSDGERMNCDFPKVKAGAYA